MIGCRTDWRTVLVARLVTERTACPPSVYYEGSFPWEVWGSHSVIRNVTLCRWASGYRRFGGSSWRLLKGQAALITARRLTLTHPNLFIYRSVLILSSFAHVIGGWDNVDTATRYWLDGPEFEPHLRVTFHECIHTNSEVRPASRAMGIWWSLNRGKLAGFWRWIPPHLAPKLGLGRTVLPRGVFSRCTSFAAHTLCKFIGDVSLHTLIKLLVELLPACRSADCRYLPCTCTAVTQRNVDRVVLSAFLTFILHHTSI